MAGRRPRPTLDRWLLLVVAAFALRALLVLVLALTQLVPHNGWYWANDDEVQYYGIAHALIHGQIADAYTFIGYGVLLAPFAIGTEFVLQAVPATVIVQLLLAGPAAFLLYRAGTRLADRRAAAVGTALWLTTPIWLSSIWLHSYSNRFALAPLWLGMQIGVDYASALLAICVLYVAAGALGDGSRRRGAVIGVLGGVAFLAKPSNIVIVGSAFVALAVWRRWHAAITLAVVSGVVVCVQLVFNARLNGNPWTFSYPEAFPQGDPHAIASISYIPRTFGKLFLVNYTGPLLGLAAVAALVVAWRRFPATRWLVVAQVAAFALFFSPLYYSISEFMLRFLTPALPALCLAAGCALVGKARAEVDAPIAPPGRMSTIACGAAILAAVVLAGFVAVAPMESVIPEAPSLVITARVAQDTGRVLLTWTAPDAPATLAYRVTRSPDRERTWRQEFVWPAPRRRRATGRGREPGGTASTWRRDSIPAAGRPA